MKRRLYARAYTVNEWMMEHDHQLPQWVADLWVDMFDWLSGVPVRTLIRDRRGL